MSQASSAKTQCLLKFNAEILSILGTIAQLLPQDAVIDRARKRATMLLRMRPLFAITRVGPELLDNEEHFTPEAIERGSAEIFLADDYVPRRAAAVAEDVGASEEDRNTAATILPRIRTALRAVDAAQRAEIMKKCAKALDIYLEWGDTQ